MLDVWLLSLIFLSLVYKNILADDGEHMAKLGCDLNDYEETLLIPLMNHIEIAEEVRGVLRILIDEQKLDVHNNVGKSTIEKIISGEKLALNGSIDLEIDEFELKLSFNGNIDLSKPLGAYIDDQSVKVCFGQPEICHNLILENSIPLWLLAELDYKKEARILIDQLELKLSIKGDLASLFIKIFMDKEKFQADLKSQIDYNESYGWVHYSGKTSISKLSTMIEDIDRYQYRKYAIDWIAILEYFYSKSDEISASICADEKCFFARGCSENLCN